MMEMVNLVNLAVLTCVLRATTKKLHPRENAGYAYEIHVSK